MQIREQGKRILCLRTAYKPEKKRTQAYQVASFPNYSRTIPDDVLALLNDAEIKKLKEWMQDRQDKGVLAIQLIQARFIGKTITEVAESLSVESVSKTFTAQMANDFWAAMDVAAKALKKAGFPKPKKSKKPAQPVDDKQLSLTEE